jgi:nitrate reductase NapAB chaperone NapD
MASGAPPQCIGADERRTGNSMSILGVIVRSQPAALPGIEQRLRALPGVDVADTRAAPDGRLVLVIEDSAEASAAATLGAIATWPEVLNTSLVYEYSGPDSPAPDAVESYRDWRQGLGAGGGKPGS